MSVFLFFVSLIRKVVLLVLISSLVLGCVYIAYKGNQPMSVAQAPKGMTYFEFMQDRVEAAKIINPARCGWGMFLSLAALGPIYSVVYTEVAIHPDGFLARVTAPDTNIDKNAKAAAWYQIPAIWWKTVERLTWTMLRPKNNGCKFRPVQTSGWTN